MTDQVNPVKVLHVDTDDESGVAKVQFTPESITYIMNMFPGKTPQEAVQEYYDLASKHLNDSGDLKVFDPSEKNVS